MSLRLHVPPWPFPFSSPLFIFPFSFFFPLPPPRFPPSDHRLLLTTVSANIYVHTPQITPAATCGSRNLHLQQHPTASPPTQPQLAPTVAPHSIHTHHQRHPATAVSRSHRLPPLPQLAVATPTAVPVYPTAVCRSPSPSLRLPVVLLPFFRPCHRFTRPAGDEPLLSPTLPVLPNTHTSCEIPVESPSIPLVSPPQRL